MADFFANEAITVAGTAIGFTAATISPDGAPGAECAYLTLEGAQIRWLADGTDPTATTGHIMDVGDTITLYGADNLSDFRAIRTGGVSGTLTASYGR